jgi:hypothetical protein
MITVLRGGGWLGDVVGETELAEESIHEEPPLIIVGIGKGEDYRNMGMDVHRLQDGSRRGGNGDVGRTVKDSPSEELESDPSDSNRGYDPCDP